MNQPGNSQEDEKQEAKKNGVAFCHNFKDLLGVEYQLLTGNQLQYKAFENYILALLFYSAYYF